MRKTIRKIIELSLVLALCLSIFVIQKEKTVAAVALTNRETAISMLIRDFSNSKLVKAKTGGYKVFKDWAKISSANRNFVGKALANSIIPKTANFSPKSVMKRSEFAKWLVLFLKKTNYAIPKINFSTLLPYRDVKSVADISNILYLYHRGIFAGTSANVFGISASLSTSALAKIKANIKAGIARGVAIANATSQIVINEYETSNGAVIADELGKYEDWIEFYNKGTKPITITGYYLSDQSSNLMRWKFPIRVVQPKEHFIVWTSGKNYIQSNGEFHTNFKLSSLGEHIILTAADGKTILDKVDKAVVPRDQSYGRIIDGNKTWRIFTVPTPRAMNK